MAVLLPRIFCKHKGKSMTTFVAEKTLSIDALRIDGGTQSRSRIYENVVSDYALQMSEGAVFPPGVAFFDGKEYWLADGFHRYHALRTNKKASMICRIVNGTVRDAILYSYGANGMHGMQMSNEDKRRIVLEMLNDFEWSEWSDREIARKCCVSHTFVTKLRASLESPQPETVKYKGSDGEVREKVRQPKKISGVIGNVANVPEATDKHDEKQEAIEYLIEENDKLKDQLASSTSDDPVFASEHIEELRAELKQTKIELQAVIKSRDMYQAECAQLKKQVASYQRQMKKAA